MKTLITPFLPHIPNLEKAFLSGIFKSAGESTNSAKAFKKGDIIVNNSTYPYPVLAVVQLTTDFLDSDNFTKCITGNSSGNILTSHIISSQWIRVIPTI